jgi:hypothetical protein
MSRAVKDELQPATTGLMNPQIPMMNNQLPKKAPLIVLDEDMQSNLVEIIMDDYDKFKSDRDSRNYGTTSKGEKLNFVEWMKRLKDLNSGFRIPKSIPWKFCSNRSLRIATSILEMLHSRLFSGIWNEDLTRWRPGEITDVPKVERISKFMGWWIRVWAPLREFFDGWVKVTAGFGDSLTETTWEVEEVDDGSVDQTPITDPMGMPVANPDGTPAVQSTPKITRYERSRSRVIPKESVLLAKNSTDIQTDPFCIEEEYPFYKLEAMEKNGQCVNITSKLLEKIPLIVPITTTDPAKIEALKRIKLRNYPVKVIRWYGHYDVDAVGFDQSVRMMVSSDYRIYLGGVRMKDVTKSGKRPIEFTKYSSYLHEIESLYGEGVLEQLRELAEEIDALFNQLSDANTIGILRPVFYDPTGDLEPQSLEIAPNRMIPVPDPARNIYIPNYEINTDRLINAIRLVSEFIEKLTAASSYVMGRESEIVGGSGTATRTQAIMQSAELRFSRPVERLKASAARILTQHLDIIQLNIPMGMETRVLGEKNQPLFQQGELSDEGISGKYDAFLLNDPTLGSKETERQVASMMYSLLLQNPLVGTDATKIYKVTADLLKSVGKDPIEYLGPEPSTDMIDSPEDENTLMIQGEFSRVKPQMTENHIEHIQKHMELMSSPTFQLLSTQTPALVQQVTTYLQAHIQEHMMMMQAMQALMNKVMGGGNKGGTPPNGGEDKQDGGDGRGANPGDKKDDANSGVENTPGPLAQAMQTKGQGTVAKPPF